MSVTREEIVNVIASHQYDRYQSSVSYDGPADLRAELAAINARNGFQVDVQTDDQGQRWLRYSGVRLTEVELDRVVEIATTEEPR